ncbi:aspartate aminotransferase family protein [Aureibaculum marinum]|uniref:Aspartate aminotransferase family protein n=1 Tax=Aureibaculum marinum TaxID=2487930 RepID=A0A3N4P1B9_9FLAO|nr:aminotransferase class III-fold pyridoxal phosphate-dependent enzyme [Aureibaculum marinum]RPE00229.1 aspartate aminotransferase family protein [Aureibaculum marinum]
MKLFDVYPLYEVTPIKGNDMVVTDNKGQDYLDFYGGHGVISIGHSHPYYVKSVEKQLEAIGFYSNAVQNPLQVQLAEKLGKMSGYSDFSLFLCNSGAEANENALKLASFHTNKNKVIAFENSFHGRTSAAVSVTDNPKIIAPINSCNPVTILPLNNSELVEKALSKGDVCAVIIEGIQGVGGLDEGTTAFFQDLRTLCNKYNVILIADEIQSGYGRSGKFFAHQYHTIQPDIISVAKGMGNGFPVGGILISPKLKASYGLLGTTFGGNHLACAASIAVLEVIENEKLLDNVNEVSAYFIEKAKQIPQVKKIKGKGLMLGLEFDFEVAELRKQLIYNYHIFTGGASNKNLLRILPPMTISKEHVDVFFDALIKILKSTNFKS